MLARRVTSYVIRDDFIAVQVVPTVGAVTLDVVPAQLDLGVEELGVLDEHLLVVADTVDAQPQDVGHRGDDDRAALIAPARDEYAKRLLVESSSTAPASRPDRPGVSGPLH